VSNVIQFPIKKKDTGNAELNVEASFNYEFEKHEMQTRVERIMASIRKINALVRELKQQKD
jgi:ribose 5-phosphate isomerase RpiB